MFAVFTSLASMPVHIEVSHSMITDSFIQALRRLIARRRNVYKYIPTMSKTFLEQSKS